MILSLLSTLIAATSSLSFQPNLNQSTTSELVYQTYNQGDEITNENVLDYIFQGGDNPLSVSTKSTKTILDVDSLLSPSEISDFYMMRAGVNKGCFTWVDENNPENGVNIVKRIGCGRIALFSILDYLANVGGLPNIYVPFSNDIDNTRTELVERIIDVVNVWVDPTGIIGGDNAGTTIAEFQSSFTELIDAAGYNCEFDIVTKSNSPTINDRLETMKKSIDKNRPFAFRTHPSSPYGWHFLTVYGYQTFEIELENQIYERTLLLAHRNWGEEQKIYYIDPLWLFDSLCDYVIFEDSNTYVHVEPNDFPFETGYPTINEECKIEINNQYEDDIYEIDVDRLRTQNYEDECIVLSAQREGAGRAYLEMSFKNSVTYYSAFASWWRINDFLYEPTVAVAQYQPENTTNWITFFDFLSKDIEVSSNRTLMNCLSYTFETPAQKIRYYVEARATGDRNRARLAIGDQFFYYREGTQAV